MTNKKILNTLEKAQKKIKNYLEAVKTEMIIINASIRLLKEKEDQA